MADNWLVKGSNSRRKDSSFVVLGMAAGGGINACCARGDPETLPLDVCVAGSGELERFGMAPWFKPGGAAEGRVAVIPSMRSRY